MSAQRRVGPRTGTEWVDIFADPEGFARSHPAAATLTAWVTDHLTGPHAELGRPGPVCPFVRQATLRHTLWAAICPGGDRLDEGYVTDIIDDAIEVYAELTASNTSRLWSCVTVFPELTCCDRIDAVHAARKTRLVSQGLMLGQFYPGCTVPGLWSREFHPLDAPVPMLVIRAMMSTDYPFLVARTEWLYAYLTAMAPALPRRLRWSIAERMRVDDAAAQEITDLRVHALTEPAQ